MSAKSQVLVIDDEADIRELLSMTLARMGLDAHCAASTTEAYSLLSQNSYDLCLTDMRLPDGDGLTVVDYVAKHRKEIAQADLYPDVRRRSVVELAERCNYWPDHAHHIAKLATLLFDRTRGIHGLTDREREWLEYAAILHDSGVHISYEQHHKHSYYLIKHGDLRGFEPDEIEQCEPFLMRQMEIIEPRAIVCLGLHAARTLLRNVPGISVVRGKWQKFRGVPLMPTYHPAYLLRSPGAKGKVWDDMQLVMKFFGKDPAETMKNVKKR